MSGIRRPVDANTLERVTRALAEKLNDGPEWMWDISILARVAIEAMEPTQPQRSKAATPVSQSPGKPSSLPLDREPLT